MRNETSRSTQSSSVGFAPPEYANQTLRNSISPRGAERGKGNSVGGTGSGSSSNLKMRSQAAMADCKILNFSLKSWIGRKKRCAYCINVTSTPTVTAPENESNPPYQNTIAIAVVLNSSTAGKNTAKARMASLYASMWMRFNSANCS